MAEALQRDQSRNKFLASGLVLAGVACLIGAMIAGRLLSDQLTLLDSWRVVLRLRPFLELTENVARITIVAWPLVALAACFRPAAAGESRIAIVIKAIVALGVWAVLSLFWFFLSVYSQGWSAEKATNADVIPGLLVYLGYVLIGCGIVYWMWKRPPETREKSPGEV